VKITYIERFYDPTVDFREFIDVLTMVHQTSNRHVQLQS